MVAEPVAQENLVAAGEATAILMPLVMMPVAVKVMLMMILEVMVKLIIG